MPIISPIESKTVRGRILIASIFAVLILGGLTMIYPFAIMISGSLRSEMDESDLDLIPRFLFDDETLYAKFLETKYNQDIAALNRGHLRPYFAFETVEPPRDENIAAQADALRTFLNETDPPKHWQVLGAAHGIRTTPESLRDLRDRLAERFDYDLEAFSRDLGAPVSRWSTIVLPPPQWTSRRYDVEPNTLYDTYFELLDEAPWANRQLVSISGVFLETMVYPTYGQLSTANFNNDYPEVSLENFDGFSLPDTVPGEDQPRFRELWIEFVHDELSASFITLPGSPVEEYHAYLVELYGDIETLNRTWKTSYPSIEAIQLPDATDWMGGAPARDFLGFVRAQPPERVQLVGPEYAWRDWLDARARAGEATIPADTPLPMAALEWDYVLENQTSLRWVYATRNFVNVGRELFFQGRVFFNTVVYCALAVLAALLINPMGAYAMSRFELPGTYKILLILMATMAFPAMVTMIPLFIMLREMSLLNTFAALVLPTAANGYMIFLLKGFFDSLPRELYEAARIDGASELRMFFQITMSLSKPILAVVALQAFQSAYTMFLYALIVTPSENMWIMNVWLYQYQATSSTSAVFASVLIACIPTLVVFLFAQNIIMRGIVVPVEK